MPFPWAVWHQVTSHKEEVHRDPMEEGCRHPGDAGSLRPGDRANGYLL